MKNKGSFLYFFVSHFLPGMGLEPTRPPFICKVFFAQWHYSIDKFTCQQFLQSFLDIILFEKEKQFKYER